MRWQSETSDVGEHLTKLFELRQPGETVAAALAAEAASIEDKSRNRSAVDAMAAARSSEAYVTGEIAFQKSVLMVTRNEFL